MMKSSEDVGSAVVGGSGVAVPNGNGAASPHSYSDRVHENVDAYDDDEDDYYTPPNTFRQRLRTARHNPCLMRPFTALMVTFMAILALIGLVLQVPTFLLGLLTAPLLRRGSWLVEFLYPLGIARWGHLLLMKWGLRSRVGPNGSGGAVAAPGTDERGRPNKVPPPQHSRSLEQRTEVVRGRVYVHPLPQLLDNVGYLILCLPVEDDDDSPALGILVDVGDAESALAQCEVLYDAHYAPLLKMRSRRRESAMQSFGSVTSVSVTSTSSALSSPKGADGNGKSNDQPKPKKKKKTRGRRLEIRAVLSTHKHHDHTAGNKWIVSDRTNALTQKFEGIYGGAIEAVPYCDRPVRDGQYVALPRAGRNDMDEIAEIECVAVPSHTRGSVVYALRPKSAATSAAVNPEDSAERGGMLIPEADDSSVGSDPSLATTHLFTGDAMFSGGGGVAFESDVEFKKDKSAAGKNAHSLIRAASGRNTMERCFAEVLVRSVGPWRRRRDGKNGGGSKRHASVYADALSKTAMIYPGHEYTSELVVRQFDASSEYHGQWTRLPPSVFFQVASHYLVSSHRRSLPKHGRMLTVPTSLGREMVVNPHFRSLRKRGEHLCTALTLWYKHCAKTKLPPGGSAPPSPLPSPVPLSRSNRSRTSSRGSARSFHSRGSGTRGSSSNLSVGSNANKTPSTNLTWTMDHDDVSRPVFTTVYTSDLDSVSSDLRSGTIEPYEAARRLEAMARRLDEPVVRRRPVPGTVPGDRNAYLGVLALLILGSPPCGMTLGDAATMGLARPTDSSDEIRISRTRLITALELLGLIGDGGGARRSSGRAGSLGGALSNSTPDVREIIGLLWREASADEEEVEEGADPNLKEGEGGPAKKIKIGDGKDSSSDEEDDGAPDELELGLLKLALYGAAMNQPSWFGKLCRPCGTGGRGKAAKLVPRRLSKGGNDKDDDGHPSSSTPRKSNGELVRHDASTCPMCLDAVGCPASEGIEESRWDGLLDDEEDEVDMENEEEMEEVDTDAGVNSGVGVGGDAMEQVANHAEMSFQGSLLDGMGGHPSFAAMSSDTGSQGDDGGIELNIVRGETA